MNNNDYQDLPAISSHWLIAMLDSPAACWRKYLDLQRPAEKPTGAMRFGTLVHALALTPKRWNQEIVVSTADRRTRAGCAHWDWLKAQGRTPVTPAEFERARAIVAALQANPEARRLLRHGKKERTIIQPRQAGLLPLKGRIDVYHESKRYVVELKTTWSLTTIQQSMTKYRYPLSAAFYKHLTRSQVVAFVFVQTTEPFPIKIIEASHDDLTDGRMMWQTALEIFDSCWTRDDWPEMRGIWGAGDGDPLMLPPVGSVRPFDRPRFETPVGELAL